MYNTVRLHSAIGYVAPKDRLEGRHVEITQQRDRKLDEAREKRRLKRDAQADRRARSATPDRPAIDFAAVRAAISLAMVLQLLGFEPASQRGAQQRGPCPLHGSARGTSRCFSANLETHAFHCFKCGRHGNALDLWAEANRQTPYDAALDLCQRLSIPLPVLAPSPANREEEPVASRPETSTMTPPIVGIPIP